MSDQDTKEVVRVATAAAAPNSLAPGGLYAIAVPEGYEAQVIDDRENADRRADAPRRRRGTAGLTRTESFVAYVKDQAGEQTPDLYADNATYRVTAVFNGGRAGAPGWGDDRAELALVTTDEWNAWTRMDGQQVSQVKFAEFVEDHRKDIKSPDGATLLEMVQDFEATTNVQFKSAQRLSNGQRQITYVEVTDGRTTAGSGGGTIEFPSTFLLAVPVFDGLEPVHVEARIRYRVGGGNLTIGFVLDDVKTLEREAFDAVLAIVEQDTGITAYHGSPVTVPTR